VNDLANLFADGQTAITKHMADFLSIPREQLWGTWPSGVNIDQFSVAALKRCWPDHDEPVKLIYIGSLSYGRNLMTLCRAVIEANQLGMKLVLLFYGEGSEKSELETFVSQTNGLISVYDTVPHDEIPEILSHAHVGTLPFPDEIQFRVSSPIKLFEYMGAGMPILATKIVCHTNVMDNEEFVYWAEDASLEGFLDALKKIWLDRFALQALGEKAKTTAIDWTYFASAKRLVRALQHGLSLHNR
jgi:glycosyltransferase involved in cell wall biosynthesis